MTTAGVEVAPGPVGDQARPGARLPELSYFFPAHNEEGNIEALVADALVALPALAERFEIIVVDDGSTDRTASLADGLAEAHPGVVLAVHHPTNLGYGAALRSGFRAARFEHVGFTDGDRQFAVADLGRLTARISEADQPDVVVGFRIQRADPLIRTLYARSYRLANRIFFGLRVTDVDCACKLFRRGFAARPAGRVGRGLLLGRAADQARCRPAIDRGDRRAPLRPDGRLGHRRPAVGRAAGGARLLEPAPAPVGQRGSGDPTRRADPGRRLVRGSRLGG